MGKLLVIDQGNTIAKLYLFDANAEILNSCRAEHDDLQAVDAMITDAGNDLDGAIFCSVARFNPRLVETLRYLCHDSLLTFTHTTPIPIKIAYDTPQTLGADRVAAAVAAVKLYPGTPLLIIDVGSAITIDYIDGNGTFCGGNISPGIKMRFRALHDYTGRLPLTSYESEVQLPKFGFSTTSALQAGVIHGVCYEVAEYARRAIQENNCKKIIFTGGDASLIINDKDLSDLSVSIHPTLVAQGLNYIYRYNETIY